MKTLRAFEWKLVRVLTLACLATSPALALGPPPVQTYYVPFPENDQLTAYNGITAVAVDPIRDIITIAVPTPGTVIYYDQWENGYESDITAAPALNVYSASNLAGTQIWGDGNPANGAAPGYPADVLPAGAVINLKNFVKTNPVSLLKSVIDFDARDKFSVTRPVAVTKLAWPDGTDTLLAGCVEVFEQGLWGTEYRLPFGENLPDTTQTLTGGAGTPVLYDRSDQNFTYSSMSLMAGAGGSSVQIDRDNDGIYEQTVVLAEGESFYVKDEVFPGPVTRKVNVGAHILATSPIQCVWFAGPLGSTYASRDSSLLPISRLSSEYYSPASTTLGEGVVTYIYNPGTAAITVNYTFRNSITQPSTTGATPGYTTASLIVQPQGVRRVVQTPPGAANFGAYRYSTVASGGAPFNAFSAIDADLPFANGTGGNVGYDGGFSLVARSSLSSEVIVGLGLGRDPTSLTNPNENGNPIYITTVGNPELAENVYVDYNGDNAGALTDSNGNRYDVLYSLKELQQQKLFDPDGDQSGMVIYTLNPAVKISAVWGQDPSVASFAQPGIDVATLVPPLREGNAGKSSNLIIDADADGFISPGDTLEYDLRTTNDSRGPFPGPFTNQDNLPVNVNYIPGSTRYRYMVAGVWQAFTAVPDDSTGTPFPLDVAGYPVPGAINSNQQLQVVFRATVKPSAALVGNTVANTGFVVISPLGITVPLVWTDVIYGSIGDFIWYDVNGNGVQDGGIEVGIPNIRVWADLNNNSIQDPGEPSSTTDASGQYRINGLAAGTYTVRVNPLDIAAADPGYGPTYDLDGLANSINVATVTLAAGQNRTDADFGYRSGASVGDRVWLDRNNNGVQDPGEPGINGVRVFIDATHYAITSGDGDYYIGNLSPGTYNVQVDTTTLPAGLTLTFDQNGVATPNTAPVTIVAAEDKNTYDFGYRGAFSIGDYVWNDVNGDNIQGTAVAEPPLAGVVVYIDSNNDGIRQATESFATTSALGAYTITNLAPGTYTVRVDTTTIPASNVPTGDLDGLATPNAAVVTITTANLTNVDFGYRNDASIGDTIWNDRNNNGVQDAGEPGIPGVIVYIDANANGVFDQATERFTTADLNGKYLFENLGAGTYAVRVDQGTLPPGSIETFDFDTPVTATPPATNSNGASRTVTASENAVNVDFGYRTSASVGDFVWVDANGDGIKQAAEVGIAGVTVYLDMNGNGIRDASEPFAVTSNGTAGAANTGITGDPTAPTTATAIGSYSIRNLISGSYTARVDTSTLPAGLIQIYDQSGILDNAATFSLAPNQTRTDVDFGYVAPSSIGDFVWTDTNGNGQQDGGELGIVGVTVSLYNATTNGFLTSVPTGPGGSYSFTNLAPGSYYLVFESVAGYVRTPATTGATATDSDANVLTGKTATITLTSGTNNASIDAGYYQPATITGSVLADTDGNGSGDSPIPSGVNLSLLDSAGNPVDGDPVTAGVQAITTTTDGAGAFSFTGLAPGTYGVAETQPSGYLSLSDKDGGNLDQIRPITVTSGSTNTANNFVEVQPGSITGNVLADTDGNGTGDAAIPGGVTLTLLDSAGNPVDGDPVTPGTQAITTTTNASGAYSFTGLLPGTYGVAETQPSGYLSVSDKDGGNLDQIRPITVTSGSTNTANNFVEVQPGSITGSVLADTDGNGSGDTPIPGGVTLTLLDSAGNPVDSDPVTAGVQPITTTTNASGAYSFTGLIPGTYGVGETQPSGYLSLSDKDGGNLNQIAPITVTAGATNTANNFVEVQPGSITGSVLADTDGNGTGDAPIPGGVTLTLLDSAGNPVDSDPVTPGVQAITTTTDGSGNYSFIGLAPGTYGVGETQPSGYLSLSDKDGGNLNQIRPITVTSGSTNIANDFVEVQPGSITGNVLADTDGNGSGDAPIPGGVTLTLLDSAGNPVDGDPVTAGVQAITTTTNAGGSYTFSNLLPGTYGVAETQPSGYLSLSDKDGGNLDQIRPITVTAGVTNTANNFVEVQPGSITGNVLADSDGNGSGDAPIPGGVTLTLLDSAGNIFDGDPVTAGTQAITTTTNAGGSYTFSNLLPGTYGVAESQPSGYLSLSDKDGGNLNQISPITVTAGATNTANNFVEVQPGSITGTVTAGGNPIVGVVLTLLDSAGNPVDGDPNTPGIQPITTTTNSFGVYTFSGVVPGSYRVTETQPAYYNNVSDKDGGNINTIGDITPILVSPGQANAGNNFVEAVDMCASTWAHWQFLHPSETAAGNPDGDASTNLAEFAFAQPFNSGAGDPWIIRPSATTPGTLEGVFTRPTNAIQNVTYTLEFANALTNPVTWTSITISAANTTVVANGDCTETVTINDLETLTGLTAGTGVVRIRADLDENNDSVIDSTTHTEVEGWKETTFGMCCSTYSQPYLREAVFTGTIDGVTGQALDLTTGAGSTDLSTLVTPGAAYYVEVTSGIGEGFRYDVSSATAATLVLANDSNLFANSGPYNNVLGAPPSVLAGSSIVLRRHWTLAEQFPPSGLTASNDKATSDQVQLFVDGQWVIYWLYSDGVSAPRWVLTGDNTLTDRATTILAPGQGVFFYNRQPSTTLLAYGEIRNNDFIRPLQTGSNLVSGGYPVDQSAAAAAGRAMSVPSGFFGSRDPAIADSFSIWHGDSIVDATGYDTYFLNNNAPRLPSSIKWVKVGDSALATQDAATLLLGNRSAFLRSKNGLAGYTDLQPWAP